MFLVISKEMLDSELGSQKSAGLTTLSGLAEPVRWSDISAVVESHGVT